MTATQTNSDSPSDVESHRLHALTQDSQDGSLRAATYNVFSVKGAPIVLGSGRYAVVLLASTSDTLTDAADLFAIKFLKRDLDSDVFNRIGFRRFIEEVLSTRSFGDEPALVKFRAFGTVLSLDTAPVAIDRERALLDLVAAYTTSRTDGNSVAIDAEAAHTAFTRWAEPNAPVAAMLKANHIPIQGPFFVMAAETATLDDLLIHGYAYHDHPLVRQVRPRAKQLQRQRDARAPDLQRFLVDFDLQSLNANTGDFSGFALLRAVDQKDRGLANRMLARLFARCVQSVVTIHQQRRHPDGYLAHRDIKPGNFLLSLSELNPESFVLRVSDLGFAAGVESAISRAGTMATSVREPGALAPGTYLFRAPEQVESGYEVHFRLSNPGSDTASSTVQFPNIGDMVVRPGDWFESSEVRLAQTSPDLEEVAKACITSTRSVDNNRYILATLSDAIVPLANRVYYHGYVTKISGQHTDLFALGSLLYFLYSGGKSPEAFFLRCLEPVPHYAVQGAKTFYRDCLSLSMALCLDTHDAIQGDLGACASIEPTVLQELDALTRRPRAAPRPRTTMGFLRNRRELVEYAEAMDKYEFSQTLRLMPSVQYYLRNANGNPIPFAVVYLICSLMLRDKMNSVVATSGNDDLCTQSYFDIDLHEQAGGVSRRIITILDRAASMQPSGQYQYSGLGVSEDQWFLSARLCLPLDPTREDAGPAGADGNLAAPPNGPEQLAAAASRSAC